MATAADPVEREDDPQQRGQSSVLDALPEVGACSTRPALTAESTHVPVEAGVDTLRLLYETHSHLPMGTQLDELPGWHVGSIPSLGLTAAEGHPSGTKQQLANAEEVHAAADRVRDVLDGHVGVRGDRGVARSDQTVTTLFRREQEARAFLAGMAAVQLPRTETTRRGHPVHSVSWTHPTGRRILARAYDKGLELGGDPFRLARLEDQRRYPSGHRPAVDDLDDSYLRERFERRFGPVRRAVDGVRAATFPVVAQAIADEVRYGYRDWREAERLAGALVLLSGAGSEAYPAGRRGPGPTYYRRRAELRDAGYVVVDDLAEAVEVNLGDVVTRALEEPSW